ncbi:MAG: hypothetical protein IIA44_08420, partial [Acidobacteria bacterium]|nr:hypothetical protein [Acidobacteriota bacterium]
MSFEPGTSLTFTVTGAVGLVCVETQVSNTAYVAGGTACGNQAEGFTNAVGMLVQAPVTSIAVVKTQVPGAPGTGATVVYQVVVTNVGTATLTDVLVADKIVPEITSVTTAAPGVMGAPVVSQVVSGTRYAWSASGLSFLPGTSLTFTVTGTIGLVCVETSVTNTAYIEATSACSVTSMVTNVTTFTLPAPPLGITVVKEQVTSGGVGTPVVYRIVVTNAGGATITGLLVVDTIAPEVTGVVTEEPAGFTGLGPVQVGSGT